MTLQVEAIVVDAQVSRSDPLAQRAYVGLKFTGSEPSTATIGTILEFSENKPREVRAAEVADDIRAKVFAAVMEAPEA